MKQVSTKGTKDRLSAGIANIYIPKDINRQVFVDNCYRNGTVSILSDNAERIDNVKVNGSLWNYIEFPNTYKELGSEIVWVNIPKKNRPVIIGILNKSNELSSTNEKEFRLFRESKGKLIEFTGNAITGKVYLISNAIEGEFNFILKDKTQKAKINVEVDGDFNIKVNKNFNTKIADQLNFQIKNDLVEGGGVTEISYIRGEGFSYKDEFGNEISITKEGIIKLIPKKTLLIGNGQEFLPLGDTLKQNLTLEQLVLTTLINAIKAAPVLAGDGGATFKAALVASLSSIKRGDYSNILSKISKTE